MSNTDRPMGARVIGTSSGGGSTSGKVHLRPVDSSNATAIFKGDFVILEDDGNVAPYTGTGGGVLLGVCVGVVVDRTAAATEHPGYLPATTAGNILVAEADDYIFAIQDDGGATPSKAIIGSNIDVAVTAGSTTTGNSAHELLMSSLTDSSPGSAQLKILDYVHADDNDPTAVNAEWIVRVLTPAYTDTTGL